MKETSRMLSRISLIGSKIKKQLKKTGCKVIFRFTTNLKIILSNKKLKTLPNSFPGVYHLVCSYECKKCEFTRFIEYQHDSMTEKRESLGAIEYTKSCHGLLDLLRLRTSAKIKNLKENYFIIHFIRVLQYTCYVTL